MLRSTNKIYWYKIYETLVVERTHLKYGSMVFVLLNMNVKSTGVAKYQDVELCLK